MACNNDCDSDPTPCTGDGCTGCGNKCHEVVDTYADIQNFRNAFVTVRDENAVYHVDEVGNPVAVSRSAIFKDNYTPVEGDYKQNIVYDFPNNKAYIFNPSGEYKEITLA